MLSCRLSPQKTYRKVISLAYIIPFAWKWQSIPIGSFLREHFCVCPHCSEAASWRFSPVLSGSSGWIACWCYTLPKRLKIVEPSSRCIRTLPGSWKSAQLCKALECGELLGLALVSVILSVMVVGFFPLQFCQSSELVRWYLDKCKDQKESNAYVLRRWWKLVWWTSVSVIAALFSCQMWWSPW